MTTRTKPPPPWAWSWLPAAIRIALTGRDAPVGLIALADTVTEMRCIKHGLQRGRTAQQRVEF